MKNCAKEYKYKCKYRYDSIQKSTGVLLSAMMCTRRRGDGTGKCLFTDKDHKNCPLIVRNKHGNR